MFLSILGAVVGGIGQMMQMQAQAAQAEYQAEIAKMNARIAQQNAEAARHAAQIDAQDQDAVTAGLLGEQLALQGASGIGVGSKSFMLTRKAAAELGRKDALNVIHAGEMEARGHLTEKANFLAQAEVHKMEAKSAKLAGFLGFASSLIGGASRVAGGSSRFSSGSSYTPTPVARPSLLT